MEHDNIPNTVSDPVDAMEQIAEWCEMYAYPDLIKEAQELHNRLVDYQIMRSDSYQSAVSNLKEYFKEAF